MAEYIDQDSIYNCNEETLDNEGYFIKKDWDEWLSEWRKHHYRNKIMLFIKENEEKINKGDVVIDEKVIKDHQNYVSIDASVSPIYLNRESLRRTCLNIARTMRKTLGKNKQDLYDFKHDKELTGLKYTNIRTKVNFIQITVIIASTIITFLETMKDKFELTNSISMTIAPILLSTYIGLALAISRFFKLDDHKEELCKLDEAQSFVISGLRHRARMIQSMMPLYCDPDVDTRSRGDDGEEIEEINVDRQTAIQDYFSKVEKIIEDQSKDGLEETMSNCKQKFDLVMNLSEKVHYKNKLLTISIDEDIVDGNKKIIHNKYSKWHLAKAEKQIKIEKCCIWKYLCCFCDSCRYHYIDKEAALEQTKNFITGDLKRERHLQHRKRMILDDDILDDDISDDDILDDDNRNCKLPDLNKRVSLMSSVSENENNFDRAFTAFNRCNSIIEIDNVRENTIISTKEDNDKKDIESGENEIEG